MKPIIALCALLALAGCSDSEGARRTLASFGFTEITTTGWSLFGCGRDATFKTGFQARSPSGEVVTGVVCREVFRGSSIRLY